MVYGYDTGAGTSSGHSKATENAVNQIPEGAIITGVCIIFYRVPNELLGTIIIDENAKINISNWPDKFNVVIDWDT